jgi:hypothetical protein
MGFAHGTRLFEGQWRMMRSMFPTHEKRVAACKALIDSLEDVDWDCSEDAIRDEWPEVKAALRELHPDLEYGDAHGVVMTTSCVHSSKESMADMAEEIGLSGEAAKKFMYALYELQCEMEVDRETGDYRLLRVSDGDQVLVPEIVRTGAVITCLGEVVVSDGSICHVIGKGTQVRVG